MGGSIAFRLAVQRPDLVAGIVSIEGGPAEAAASPGFRRAMRFAPLLRAFGGRRVVQGRVHHHLRASSGDPSWVTEEVMIGYTADAAREFGATLDAFKAMAESREPWTLASRLSGIRCPVRLLLGTAPHEGGIPHDEVVLLQDSLPLFAVDSVPGVGHFVYEERPSAIVGTVERLRLDRAAAGLSAPRPEACGTRACP